MKRYSDPAKWTRSIFRLVALCLALCAMSVEAMSVDDKENAAPTNWWVFSNLTQADIGRTLQRLKNETQQQVRISDIQVTSNDNFTVTYVQNTGTYGKQWWWYPSLNDRDLSNYLSTNNARLISLRAYDAGGGNVRYAAVMISNTGADAKTWWWGANLTEPAMTELLKQRNARLTSLESYEVNGRTYYAVIMVANTGSEQRTWWCYMNASGEFIAQNLTSKTARLLDLTPSGNGKFNAVMEVCPGQCPGWWWYYGNANTIIADAQKNGARITTAGTYPGCGSYCYAVLMTQGSLGAEHGELLSWSRGSLPFDLVWPTNSVGSLTDSGTDRNGSPLNPRWFSQLSRGPDYRPDFQNTCFKPLQTQSSTLFGISGAGSLLGSLTLPAFTSSICTTQRVKFDAWSGAIGNFNVGPVNLGGPAGSFASLGGACAGLMNGHLNWWPVTATGTLYWDDWSNSTGDDNDYNFSLVHADHSGLTSVDIGNENTAPSPAFLLEFNSDETTGLWGSQFWKQFRYDVEQAPRHEGAHWVVDGLPAVVTGLLGLDGVHAGYTELHPVYSIAIHLLPDSPAKPDGKGGFVVAEHWAVFIRNYGTEGNCSSQGHFWQPFGPGSKDSAGRPVYYIQLPWHEDDGVAAESVDGSGNQAWMWQDGESWGIESNPGHWTYLQFHLGKQAYAGADADIWLRYTKGHVLANPVVAPIRRGPPARNMEPGRETEVDFNEIQNNVTDPAIRAELLKAFRIRPTVPASSAKPVPVDSGITIYHQTSADNQETLQEDHPTGDPIKDKRLADIKTALGSQKR